MSSLVLYSSSKLASSADFLLIASAKPPIVLDTSTISIEKRVFGGRDKSITLWCTGRT